MDFNNAQRIVSIYKQLNNRSGSYKYREGKSNVAIGNHDFMMTICRKNSLLRELPHSHNISDIAY